jgi:pimeloyl-ACP methyl ester carboxylesterase
MLAICYDLMYPEAVEQLVLVDPTGLEDWKAKGALRLGVDQWRELELKTTADRIPDYERTTYYAGAWSAAYEIWVQMPPGLYRGASGLIG